MPCKYFITTVISECIPATFRVVAAVISVDGPVFGVLVLDKEGESIMQITKVRVIYKKVKMDRLIGLGYKKVVISESKTCMGLMYCREDAHDVGDNASLRVAQNHVIFR